MIEYTGNIQVRHRDDMAQIWGQHRALVNRITTDQNNPDGDRR